MSEQRRTPIETDALGAIHKELVIAARRRKAVREHRRRLATIAATIVATLACVAGASALTDIGTGIPPIDRFLGNHSSNIDWSTYGQGARRPLSRLNDMPKEGSPAVAVEVPWGEAPEPAVGSLYLSAGNRLCFAFVLPVKQGSDVLRGAQPGCDTAQVLSRRLADEHALIAGLTFGRSTIVHGYAKPSVEVIGAYGPDGALEVHVSDVLRPESPDTPPLRLFVASRTATATDAGRWRESAPDAGDPRKYVVRVRLPDGSVVERSPLPEEGGR